MVLVAVGIGVVVVPFEGLHGSVSIGMCVFRSLSEVCVVLVSVGICVVLVYVGVVWFWFLLGSVWFWSPLGVCEVNDEIC